MIVATSGANAKNIYTQCSHMVAVKISPYQSTSLFGWWNQPILTLSWHDIKQKNFTWRQLRALGLTAEQLKNTQSAVSEWIQRGGIQITDIPDMTVFPVNPLTDFGVDLSELWSLKCECGEMKRMGITYEQLIERGITPQIMHAFNMPLSSWVELGFGEEHAGYFSDTEARHVFAVQKNELLQIIRTFSPPQRNALPGV